MAPVKKRPRHLPQPRGSSRAQARPEICLCSPHPVASHAKSAKCQMAMNEATAPRAVLCHPILAGPSWRVGLPGTRKPNVREVSPPSLFLSSVPWASAAPQNRGLEAFPLRTAQPLFSGCTVRFLTPPPPPRVSVDAREFDVFDASEVGHKRVSRPNHKIPPKP